VTRAQPSGSDARGGEDELRALIALHHAPGLGAAGTERLLAAFGSAGRALAAERRALAEHGLSRSALEWVKAPDWDAVDADLAWADRPGRHVMGRHDPRYPWRLATLPDPPPVLFVSGDPEVLDQPQLAVVGSRNPSAGGAENAAAFAGALAGHGLVIASGLALGIDGAAHRAALDAGGLSVAVSATGPDRVYPARHRQLARDIVAEGAVVTELSPGTPPRGRNFPQRNRILSGLTAGVLVVEATPRSGSLISARLAMEQGREVFAVPGSIHNPLARGCHALIRQGAKLVETADDILEELAPVVTPRPGDSGSGEPAGRRSGPRDADYERLLEALGHDPVSLDTLVLRSGLTPDQVSSMLLVLELQGEVAPAPGGRYSRVS